jgi:hypothetical protein
MKKHVLKALAVLAIIGATSQTQAYSYIFSNHTTEEIGVGMRYYGLGEPRYYRWIPSHQARQFTPGQATRSPLEREVEYRKIGFIGKTFWYVTNPTEAQKQDPKAIAWREFQITWVPTEAYQLAIDLCEAVGAATIEAAKLALEAAMAAATDGASVAVKSATTTAKDALDTLKKAGAGAASAGTSGMGMSSTSGTGSMGMSSASTMGMSAASNTESKSTVLKKVQDGMISDALTKLLSAVGKSASRSMMTDRHIDIIEDEGQIKFISLL